MGLLHLKFKSNNYCKSKISSFKIRDFALNFCTLNLSTMDKYSKLSSEFYMILSLYCPLFKISNNGRFIENP